MPQAPTMFAAAHHHSPASRPAPAQEPPGQKSLILHIAQDGLRCYRARMFDDEGHVGSATQHATLHEAICWYGQSAPVAGVQAFRIWYGGWCAGSFGRDRMEREAHEIADRLLVLALVER